MRLTNKKGFTLIELAIVLVIIGILLGLVLRGSELIESARTKKIREIPRKWEVPIWTFYDKRGFLPGDINTDGSIDNFGALKGALTGASIAYPPDKVEGVSIEIKGLSNVCNTGVSRNVMLIGWQSTGATLDLEFAKRIDEDIDGQLSGASGRVRYCGTNGIDSAGSWPTNPGNNVVATYFFDRVIP